MNDPAPITGTGMRGVTERNLYGHPVLTVSDPNALTQVLGWLKFANPGGQVLFRGQSEIFGDMLATGLRTRSRKNGGLSRDLRVAINGLFGAACACTPPRQQRFSHEHQCREVVPRKRATRSSGHHLVSGTYRAVVEPLVQHYGLPTRWLDVVDNVWIALWFACHRQVKSGRHAFHLRRSPSQEGPDARAFIAAMATGDLATTAIPGYRISDQTRVVDLRSAVPSIFLRPHAQHGLLMAPRLLPTGSSGSLDKQVVAYIEVRLGDALDWLGTGAMLDPFVLFPPAALDSGFQRLLEGEHVVPTSLGQFTIYGPGY